MSTGRNTADALWQKVVQDYRQFCVLQRQARREESSRLLQTELPASILEWSEREAADGFAKARRLDEMFQQEQRRVADAWLAQEFMEQRLRTQLLPSLSARIDEEVRKAVTQNAAQLAPVQSPAPRAVPPRSAPVTARATENSRRPARVAAGDIASIIDLILEGEQPPNAQPLAA